MVKKPACPRESCPVMPTMVFTETAIMALTPPMVRINTQYALRTPSFSSRMGKITAKRPTVDNIRVDLTGNFSVILYLHPEILTQYS
jgi:hypothetical protein